MMRRGVTLEEFEKVASELQTLKKAVSVSGARMLLEAALRVINRAGLTDQYVEELLLSPSCREAKAADFGISEAQE